MIFKNIRLLDLPNLFYGFNKYQKGDFVKAEHIFRNLTEKNDDSSYLYFRYGMCLYKQGFWEEAIEAFLEAKTKEGYKESWNVQLEVARKNLNNKLKNVSSSKQYYEENKSSPKALLRYIQELYDNKSYWIVIHATEEFINREGTTISLLNILSLCYEKLTNHKNAIRCLEEILQSNKINNQEYLYRYAYNLECLGCGEKANVVYEEIISTGGHDLKKYGIGLMHQKYERWELSAKSYEAKIKRELNPDVILDLYLRCAYVYGRMYKWLEAAEKYQCHIKSNRFSIAHTYFKCGESFEKAYKLEEAASYYSEATLRSNEYQAYWYYRLAYVLKALGKIDESNDIFYQSRKNTLPYGIAPNAVLKNKNQVFLASYVEYYESLTIKDNYILFESFLGNNFSCNPYALLRYVLANDDFLNFRFVVIINDIKHIPSDLNDNRIIFIKRQSDAYLRYLATCKYLINNVSFPYYFIRKPEQVYLNTWHGTPLKTLGKDIKEPLFDYANVARNFLQCTHIISQNRFTNDVLLDKYNIRDMYSGSIAETGYPRVDLTLNLSKKRKREIFEILGVDDKKPIVVYAPTWRGTSDNKKTDNAKLIKDLSFLNSNKYYLIFKAHHLAEEAIKQSHLDVIIAASSIDTNELLACADILISDYSSIVFDFLKRNKPIISYIYDYHEYKKVRGLYVKQNEFLGETCKSILDVRKKVLKNLEGLGNYVEEIEQYAYLDDGQCSERVINYVFNNDKTYEYKYIKKPVHLMFNGPYIPNGISRSFDNLLKNLLKLEKFNTENKISVVVNGADIKSHAIRTQEFKRNYSDNVAYHSRIGLMPMSIEEVWVREQFETSFRFESDNFKEVYNRMFKREARRLFGETQFYSVVNFEGFSLFWASLLSNVSATKKIIYQHSDIYSEWKTRFPYLEGVVNLYLHYNKIISVSKLTMLNNISNLSSLFSLDESKFYFTNNSILHEEIELKSLEIGKLDELFSRHEGQKIVSIGRLSREKDHEKLLKAFARSDFKENNTKLYIIGSGPLEQYLLSVIHELDLLNHVYLLGQVENPYPYLKQTDLFVLPSNHEGQPMVLLEALVLNRPILATDIVGNRGILKNRYGKLVDNSVEGLLTGINFYFKHKDIPNKEMFNANEYNQQAINQFLENIYG